MSISHDKDFIKTQIRSGEPPDLTHAATMGGYKILRSIGKGGMGEVYLGYEPNLRRYVAIKTSPAFVRTDFAQDERFLHEAQAVAALKHPNIVSIYHFGEEKGICFFAMEFIDGINLLSYIKSRGTPSLKESLKIMLQCTNALKYAADLGVIHRDVKPSNVLLDQERNVHIADFGLAKQMDTNVTITQLGSIVGTPHYMSPEQAKGDPVDLRSDIYSLGCMFYFLLEGKPPFDGYDITQVILKHVNNPIPEITHYKNILKGKLVAVLRMMTAINLSERYQNYDELIYDLKDMDKSLNKEGESSEFLPRIPSKPRNAESARIEPHQTSITINWKSPWLKRIGLILIGVIFVIILYGLWDWYQQGNFLSSSSQ